MTFSWFVCVIKMNERTSAHHNKIDMFMESSNDITHFQNVMNKVYQRLLEKTERKNEQEKKKSKVEAKKDKQNKIVKQ